MEHTKKKFGPTGSVNKFEGQWEGSCAVCRIGSKQQDEEKKDEKERKGQKGRSNGLKKKETKKNTKV